MRRLFVASLFCCSLPVSFVAMSFAAEMNMSVAADEPMETYDLSTLGEEFPVTIQAPAGAETKVDIGNVAVNKGENFKLQISSSKADIAALKKEIVANTMNKLKKFHTETDDVLLYETDVFGNAEFHFVANVKVGEKVFGCEDEKGPRYTKEDVDAMLKSAQSLAAKK